jgi:hypothetical protein
MLYAQNYRVRSTEVNLPIWLSHQPAPAHSPSALYQDLQLKGFRTLSPFLSCSKFQFLIMAEPHNTLQIQPFQISLGSVIYVCMYTRVFNVYLNTHKTHTIWIAANYTEFKVQWYYMLLHFTTMVCVLNSGSRFYCKSLQVHLLLNGLFKWSMHFSKANVTDLKMSGRPWCCCDKALW